MKKIIIKTGMFLFLMLLFLSGTYAQNQGTYSIAAIDTGQPYPITVNVVTQPQNKMVCYNGSLSLSFVPEGGQPYYYQWKKEDNAITGATDSIFIINSVSMTDEGLYSCEFRNACDTAETLPATVMIVSISADASLAGNICSGNSVQLQASASSNHSAESGVISFLWLPATGLSSTNVNNPSANPVTTSDYIVTATDQLNCSASDTVSVFVQNPCQNEQICLVTVDTIAWKNKVMWEKTADAGTEQFYVYKEIATNVYGLIGIVPIDSASYYIDFNSAPESHGDKYKITVFDTCGNESAKSPYHKTMNLVISCFGSTMGLSWTAYEDQSGNFVPAKYYIYRGAQLDNMQLLDSVTGSFTSYNDANVFDVYYYMIGVQKDTPCNTGGSGNARKSYSNRKDNSTLVGIEHLLSFNELNIYPNPAIQNFTVLFDKSITGNIFLNNITGQLILKTTLKNEKQKIIDVSVLPSGVYSVKVVSAKNVMNKIIVIE